MGLGQPLEEEQLLWYNSDQFYPVCTREIPDYSFNVMGKLGYGAHSTVWLCRDIKSTLKTLADLCVFNGSYSSTSTLVYSVLCTMVNPLFVVHWEHLKSPVLSATTTCACSSPDAYDDPRSPVHKQIT
ncbi:hypothetical protein CC78DRAFT_573202 [Lojkania enalia]|uniref:Uncharacterized protein n=1 Tax=Lojkania enalia TaxID=147567 RepID=A0A9P4ND10_9PLEO|nr:hypothetical protein CC78DRAFT_573202 [Didymosphaeria enalia]